MSTTNPYGAYLQSKVLSASPLELICLAYEGAYDAIGQARVHLGAKRISERSLAITKAQCIIHELQHTLDFARGASLSVQLASLYDYIQGRLREANFRQIEEPLIEAQGLLETLLEGWREITRNEKSAVMNTPVDSPVPSSAWMSASMGGVDSRFDLVL